MQLQLNQDAQIDVAGVVDAGGNPALVDGDLKWSVKGDLSLGDLQVAADFKSAKFVRNGGVGLVTVQVSADADLGPGEALIMAEVDLDCLGGVAATIKLNAVAVDKVP